MSDPYIGQIVAVAFDYAPQQWALCQGQSIPVNQNQALYALIGTRYGGTANQTFNLPDLRGRVIVGAGGSAQGVNGAPTVNLADKGGQVQVTQVAPHTHPATFTAAGGGAGSPTASGQVSIPVNASFSNVPVSVSGAMNASSGASSDNVPKAGQTLATLGPGSAKLYATPSGSPVALAAITSEGKVSGSATGTASGNISLAVTGVPGAGGTVTVSPNTGAAQTLMPPYLGLNNIIAVMGLYPVRE